MANRFELFNHNAIQLLMGTGVGNDRRKYGGDKRKNDDEKRLTGTSPEGDVLSERKSGSRRRCRWGQAKNGHRCLPTLTAVSCVDSELVMTGGDGFLFIGMVVS
jgi:hypothetical protein